VVGVEQWAEIRRMHRLRGKDLDARPLAEPAHINRAPAPRRWPFPPLAYGSLR
jgi:hypothetical protein